MMNGESIQLTTSDGPFTLALFRPATSAPLPPVLFAMDGFGPRETLYQMARRIAAAGYVVALPDLYHRVGSILDLVPAGVPRDVPSLLPLLFSDQELRSRFRDRYFASATKPDHVRTDLSAVLDYLRSRPDVRPGPAGIVGYCLGGHIALRAAALFGSQLGAVASFHGGHLVTDAADSPHLGAPQIRARVLVIGAQEDATFSEASKERLATVLQAAQVRHHIETYPGRHGFCVPALPSYDAALAERHYAELAELFAATL